MVLVRLAKYTVKNKRGFSYSSEHEPTVRAIMKAIYEPEFSVEPSGEEFEIYDKYKPKRIPLSIT